MSDDICILMAPDYRRDNPYQALLARGLESEGCRVAFAGRRRGALPLRCAVQSEEKVDVLHLHWTSPYLKGRILPSYLAYLVRFRADLAAVRRSGCKIVWTLHNLAPHDTRHLRLELLARRSLCRIASAVIVHGRAGQEEALHTLACPADRVFIIPHGHYRDAYAAALPRLDARQRLGLPGDARVILFFGFLRPYKGLEMLLSAWRKLNPPHAMLLIAGKSQEAGYAAELARQARAAQNVRLCDRFVPPDEVPAFFGAADAVALPFRAVQTSGSMVLAMSYGRPVIAPRMGELPETLEGAADLLFAAGDEADLLRQLSRALVADLADLGRRTSISCDRLDWKPIAAATAEVYRRAISEGTS